MTWHVRASICDTRARHITGPRYLLVTTAASTDEAMFQRGSEMLQRVLEIDGRHAASLWRYASALMRDGCAAVARELVARALQLEPASPDAIALHTALSRNATCGEAAAYDPLADVGDQVMQLEPWLMSTQVCTHCYEHAKCAHTHVEPVPASCPLACGWNANGRSSPHVRCGIWRVSIGFVCVPEHFLALRLCGRQSASLGIPTLPIPPSPPRPLSSSSLSFASESLYLATHSVWIHKLAFGAYFVCVDGAGRAWH